MKFLLSIFFRYEAGDHLAVYPTNDTEAVNSLGKILNVDLDEIFSLQNIDGKQDILNIRKLK